MFNFSQIEQRILKFWDKNKTFEKSLKKKSPQGDFVFYDGPPFATGTPHYGHIVASLIKDIVPRYWTMKGCHIERKWGWDCHGLPIENIVEEEMNIKSKKQIEEIGVAKFNETCRSKVLIYAEEWKKVIHRFGRWVDMDDDYKTMDRDYMESIWWVFKELWDKGLIYEGYKSMHICPRCETTLSQHEVSEGYKDIEDVSVIVKFELTPESVKELKKSGLPFDKLRTTKNIYILSWTTTPWTLPGNVALAMGEKLKYVLVESQNKKFILVKQNLDSIFENRKYKVLQNIKAKDLENKKYKPLFDYYLDLPAQAGKDLENRQNLYSIQLADFVTVEDGTGVVHIAPAFGEDDMNLGKEKNLPFIQHVKMDGHFTNDVVDFKNQEVKPKTNPGSTDRKVLDYLEKKGLVFNKIPFTHSYPHCWRCDSPLLNYATSSLFVNVMKIKEQALKAAKGINWVPAHIKEGRFGKWLQGAKDWSISRQRFWGSVIPIWVCDKCGDKKVFGSVKELEKVSGEKIEDLHKHFVDKYTFKCEKCSGTMKRVPDVLDCWFESGSMPYAQIHYPFENKKKFEKNFPAQFIAEGIDHTRAWFYYLHILATALKNSHCFKNVVVNGMVLAEDGKKMSKHLKNYPDPTEVMEKYGADAMRYYLTNSSVMKAEDLNFSEKDLKEQCRFLTTLINVFAFYQMFSQNIQVEDLNKKNITNVLDQWILSKLNLLIKSITNRMDDYDLNSIREIPVFINDLSTWYVRRSRHRFKSEDKTDKTNALSVLRECLLRLSLVMAPFMPFLADHLYQELHPVKSREAGISPKAKLFNRVKNKKQSVHLQDWPKFDKNLISKKLLSEMQTVRKVCELGHNLRVQARIKVRQPMSQLIVSGAKFTDNLTELIKDELNIKEVDFVKDLPQGNDPAFGGTSWQIGGEGNIKLALNKEITPELKRQGLARELVRQINALRKQAGLTKDNQINVYFQTKAKELKEVLEKEKKAIKKETISRDILDKKVSTDVLVKKEIKINGQEIVLILGK